jgi:hypothetical protein
MTVGQTAANAEFTIDGVAFSRASNIIDDVVPRHVAHAEKGGARTGCRHRRQPPARI